MANQRYVVRPSEGGFYIWDQTRHEYVSGRFTNEHVADIACEKQNGRPIKRGPTVEETAPEIYSEWG